MLNDTFFGAPAQQALLGRGRALFDLLRDDPALSYYGRTVGMLRPLDDEPDRFARLIALQGASTYSDLGEEEAGALAEMLEAQGMAITRYDCWEGASEAMGAAAAILESVPLPDGILVHEIDADTPGETLAALAEVSLGCGVLPVAGSVLRGTTRPGLGLVAIDGSGRPVSCAAAAAFAHPDHPRRGGQAWWGMLATDPACRGQRLALILGAMAMRRMQERFGFADFMTGVQPGNAASEAVCRASGLSRQGRSILTVVDAAALPGGKMTS